MSERVPDILLERYLLGELPAVDRARIEKTLARDARLRERLRGIERTNREILEQYPPSKMVTRIRTRAAGAGQPAPRAFRPPVRALVASLTAVAAAAAIFFTYPLYVGGPRVDDGSETVRVKGSAISLKVYRKRANGAELLGTGASVRSGDLLQLAYFSARGGHVVVLSIDGSGSVTMHYPRAPRGTTAAAPNRITYLPRSYELDDAPRFERFILVASPSRPDIEKIRKAAERLARDPKKAVDAPLPLDAGYAQESILLKKVK